MPTSPYYVDGKRIPSVTTVISRFKESGGLVHWAWQLGIEGKDYRAERDRAASSGTLAHSMIEADISGEALKLAEDIDPAVLNRARVGFDNYKLWAEQSKLEVIDTEMHMVSEKYRYGGTPDAVGLVNGQLSILDWKTSRALYADHLCQVVAYRQLWEENHPDQPITGGVHICRFSPEHADFEHRHFASDLGSVWDTFELMRRLYDSMAELKKRVR